MLNQGGFTESLNPLFYGQIAKLLSLDGGQTHSPRTDDNVVDFYMADKLHSTYVTNHSYISTALISQAGNQVFENMHLIPSLDCTLMAIERSHYIASIGDFP